MWGGSLLPAVRGCLCVCVSCRRHDNTGGVVLCRWKWSPPSTPQIHNLGNGKGRKLLIKDVPTLWLLQAVCRHLESAASSPLEEKKTGTYWSADGETAHLDKSPTNTPLPPLQRGKIWGGGGGGGLGENKHTRGHIWRYIYTFSPHDESTFDVF